jgi:hypothetical protein
MIQVNCRSLKRTIHGNWVDPNVTPDLIEGEIENLETMTPAAAQHWRQLISGNTDCPESPYAYLLERERIFEVPQSSSNTNPPNQQANPNIPVVRGKVATRPLKQMRLFPDNPKTNAGRGKVVTRPLQQKRPPKSNPINPKRILIDTITEPDGVLENRPPEPITTTRPLPNPFKPNLNTIQNQNQNPDRTTESVSAGREKSRNQTPATECYEYSR